MICGHVFSLRVEIASVSLCVIKVAFGCILNLSMEGEEENCRKRKGKFRSCRRKKRKGFHTAPKNKSELKLRNSSFKDLENEVRVSTRSQTSSSGMP